MNKKGGRSLRHAKPGRGGDDVGSIFETFRWSPAGKQSRLGEMASTQKEKRGRVLFLFRSLVIPGQIKGFMTLCIRHGLRHRERRKAKRGQVRLRRFRRW